MKSKKEIYKLTNKNSLIREELGLNIYSTEEKRTPVVIKPKRAKTSSLNDIDLSKWKEYSEIITDSLWLIGSRDKSGVHTGELHGNFIPQIPHQAMLRYTKREDWVLDTFLGSGTTLIECRKLGRNGIGIELFTHLAKVKKL